MLAAIPARMPALVGAAVTLPVNNWRLALAWYQQVLGCEVVGLTADESGGEVVELRLGISRFSVWLDWGDPHVRLAGEEVRAPHLVLLVRSVPAMRKALTARGAAVRRTPTGLAMVEDPFGNRLLLMTARAPRRSAKQVKAVLAYLEATDDFRTAVRERLEAEGIAGFADQRARRAFLRKHALVPPRRLTVRTSLRGRG